MWILIFHLFLSFFHSPSLQKMRYNCFRYWKDCRSYLSVCGNLWHYKCKITRYPVTINIIIIQDLINYFLLLKCSIVWKFSNSHFNLNFNIIVNYKRKFKWLLHFCHLIICLAFHCVQWQTKIVEKFILFLRMQSNFT